MMMMLVLFDRRGEVCIAIEEAFQTQRPLLLLLALILFNVLLIIRLIFSICCVCCPGIGGCAALPSIDNGFIRYETNGYMPGSVAPVFCYPGFHPYPRSAQPLFICTNDGQWRPFDEFVSLTCTGVLSLSLLVLFRSYLLSLAVVFGHYLLSLFVVFFLYSLSFVFIHCLLVSIRCSLSFIMSTY